MSRRRQGLAVLGRAVLALTGLALMPAAVPAARAAEAPTFTVASTVDGADDTVGDGVCASAAAGGKCTLRAAVQEADAPGGGGGTVRVPAGHYTLTIPTTAADMAAGSAGAVDGDSGDLDVTTGTVTIRGAGARLTTVDADGLDRVIATSNVATLTLTDMTFTGGDPSHAATSPGIALGGAILNQGTMHLQRMALVRNRADGGGGLFSVPGTSPLVEDSLVADNLAYGGGGLRLDSGGTIVNTTITGNTLLQLDPLSSGLTTRTVPTAFAATVDEGSGWGGGLDNRGGADVVVTNSTITGNHALKGGGGLSTGQGYAPLDPAAALGRVTLQNSIVAGNTSDAGGNCHVKDQVIESLGHNIATDESCFLTAAGDLAMTDPLLGPLADNGGPTSTQALLASSPAIGAGAAAACPDHDQRGVPRAKGEPCDIGAFQAVAVSTTTTPVVVPAAPAPASAAAATSPAATSPAAPVLASTGLREGVLVPALAAMALAGAARRGSRSRRG